MCCFKSLSRGSVKTNPCGFAQKVELEGQTEGFPLIGWSLVVLGKEVVEVSKKTDLLFVSFLPPLRQQYQDKRKRFCPNTYKSYSTVQSQLSCYLTPHMCWDCHSCFLQTFDFWMPFDKFSNTCRSMSVTASSTTHGTFSVVIRFRQAHNYTSSTVIYVQRGVEASLKLGGAWTPQGFSTR